MNDALRVIVLILVSPLVGIAIILYGCIFPLVLAVIFIGYILVGLFKKEAK